MTIKPLLTLAGLLLTLQACTDADTGPPTDDAADPLQRLSIDAARITVSGLSSGGYMASQLHVAHSDVFSGAGIIAAGPWWCAQGDISRALGVCIKGGDFQPQAALNRAQSMAAEGNLAALENLKSDPVFLFSGSNDAAVSPAVVSATEDLYQQMGAEPVVLINSVPAAHGFPTVDQGKPCDEFAPPYINACDYDLAGALLQHLEGRRAVPGDSITGTVMSLPVAEAKAANLMPDASLYVPPQCLDGSSCGVHVVLHGCQQSAEVIGDALVQTAGYNRWADALDLVVLYPQVAATSLVPMNPLGCWDWWGYTGADYTSRTAPQQAAIINTIQSLQTVKP